MFAGFFRAVLDLIGNTSLLMLGVLGFCYVRDRIGERWPRLSEVAQGLIGAVLALFSMLSPLPIGPGVQIDSRNSIVVIITLFGGPIAGAIAGACAAGYRLWLGGAGAMPGAVGIAAAYAIALGFRRAILSRGDRVRHVHILVLGFITAGLVLAAIAAASWISGADLVGPAALPILLIVPLSLLLFGAIVIRFDRARTLEHAIVENEALFRAIVDNLPETLSVRDRGDRYVLVNREYEVRYGQDAGALLGRLAPELWQSAGIRSILEDDSRSAWAGQTSRTPPLAIKLGRGPGWVVCTTFPIRNAGGEIVSVGTLASDVTELVAAREALQDRERSLLRHQQALTDLLRGGAGARRTFVDQVKPILETAAEALDVDKITVWEMDHDADRVRCVDEWYRPARRHGPGPDERISDFVALLGDLERSRVLAIDDSLRDPRLEPRRNYFRDTDTQSCLIAASYLGPRMQAFLTLSQIGRRRSWTPEEMTFAQSVAGVLSLILITSQHRDALAALDLVTNAIFAEREDGRVIYANRSALALAGLDQRRPWALPAAGATARLFPRPDQPLKGERDLHALKWTVDGHDKDLEVHRSRLPDGGTVSVIIDVTAQRAGARERQRLEAQLQQASRMEAIGQLAGGIAHDFNNLLGAISGFADFLDQDLPPDSQQHLFARRILDASERGKALVNQILTFTRVRALERKPLDLRDVISRSRELLLGSMPTSIRLGFRLGDESVPVLGNEEQVSQLLSNLCLNARDAMADRGGDIDVGLAVVAPGAADYGRSFLVGSLDTSRRYARIEVRDSGVGISPELLPRVFEPFFTTKERGRGTGLGLAIVHGIVVSHEGACAVESAPGRGTSFLVYLPLSTRSAAASAPSPGVRDVRGRERVLVVDDEVDITDMLSIGLERLGYEAASVNSSLEALQVFQEDPQAWDVVVTDHLMPDLLGLDLAKQIKAIRSDTVVIVCTGLNDGTVAAAAEKAGIAFVPKPASAAVIAASIRDAEAVRVTT